MLKKLSFGPAILVTAAFIGPGTVITASLAGAHYGYALLWALLFSVIATIVLQEMAARLGIVTQQGLGENINDAVQNPIIKGFILTLIFCAIVIGNGAYQGGNISGASLGLAELMPTDLQILPDDINQWSLLIGIIAFLLMWIGNYATLEKALIFLVGLMSLSFLATFIISTPSLSKLFSGLFIPSIPDGAALTIIALIGTTVVPYNLFLHSSSASQKWHSVEQLPQARKDLFFAIPLGGLISVAIVSTAASAFFGQQVSIKSVADLAPALQPLFGDFASTLMAVGLFSAGISSAITAPLAAAFALSGIFKLPPDLRSIRFKLIWIVILLLGMSTATLGMKPIKIIWFAQVANGLLLPIVSCFLLWMMNQNKLRKYKNNTTQNILGGLIILITLLLSGRSLMSAFGLL